MLRLLHTTSTGYLLVDYVSFDIVDRVEQWTIELFFIR